MCIEEVSTPLAGKRVVLGVEAAGHEFAKNKRHLRILAGHARTAFVPARASASAPVGRTDRIQSFAPYRHIQFETFPHMKILAPLIVSISLVGAACTPVGSMVADETTMAQRHETGPASEELLAARRADYQEVFDQAQRQGFISGAVRGALLGALIDSERGAVIGAAFGAILGSGYAAISAEHLLQEREEFLNRQQIIENILDASRGATARSMDDADLVSRAVTEQTRIAAAPDAEEQLRLGESIATVRRAAEMRAVLIEELLQEAELTPEEQAEVREQITLQRQALSVIRAQQQAWETRTNG